MAPMPFVFQNFEYVGDSSMRREPTGTDRRTTVATGDYVSGKSVGGICEAGLRGGGGGTRE